MKTIKALLLLTIATLLTACGSDDDAPQTKRTILVYMVASNTLGGYNYDDKDIAEMQSIIESEGLNGCRWLVYLMPKTGEPTLKEFTKSGVKTLSTYSSSDYAVDPDVMTSVFADMKRYAPANEYGLILWSHSDGWVAPLNPLSSISGRSFGEDRSYNMSIPDLANALTGQNFNFIYFDCCYMSNIESLYELRHCSPYIVASATEIAATGMPYDENIPLFCADNVDLQQACENTFNYYNNNTDPKWRSCSISLIDTRNIDRLAQVSRSIFASGATIDPNYIPQQLQPETEAQFLFDFPDYMRSLDATNSYRADFDTALSNVVIYTRHTEQMWPTLSYGWRLDRCNGISSYIIRDIDDASYRGYSSLQWWSDVVSVAFENNINKKQSSLAIL